MGQQQSKPVQSIFTNKSKENRPPQKVPHKNVRSPKMKVNFNYIKPLNHDMEEIPDEQTIEFDENQSSNFRSSTQIEQSQSYFTYSHVEEIKVRWNSFAKMKNRNYLTDYEVIKKIGRGGFGIVNKVRSLHTQVIRAAKVIKKKQLKQDEHKKLLQQLTIMRSLDHPNIVKIYEVYDYKDQYTLILELMSGGQLYKKVKGKRISQKLARNYMKQIIRTLIYIHSQGIVHRDLKPQNMLFQYQGSNNLKIIDFGIATTLQPDYHLTDRIGTPYFIAPQVIYKKYNEKCDIWSAGVIFYMMLTGMMPFKAQNEVNLLQTILREQPNFTGSSFQRCSIECIEVLKLMLQKKPEKRPSAFEIFNHKWFSMEQEGTEIVDQKKQEQILSNIRKFNFNNKLQAVVHTFIASQLLSSQQKSILVSIFKQLDLNNDGVISSQELKQALERKRRISMQRVQFLVKIIDTNCSGQIEYTQFLVAGLSSDQFMKRQHFEKAFAYFDIDHSGTITYQEVVQFLQNYQQSQEQIRKMFNQVDSNGDGEIDKQEFIKLFICRTSQLKLLYDNSDFKSIKQLQPTLKERRKMLLEQLNLNSLKLDDIRYCDD